MRSPVDEIKSRLDIVELIQGYIKVQKAGRNYRACCPFHSEKTPSMMISPEKQIWHCFGCGKGGSIFDFVMEMEGLEFSEALRALAKRAGVELSQIDAEQNAATKTEKSQLYEVCDWAARFYEKQLESRAGKKILEYLAKRGLELQTIKEWQIGYAPAGWQSLCDFLSSRGYSKQLILKSGLAIEGKTSRPYDRFRDRIIFPIFDLNGAVIGFTGRENPDTPAGENRLGKYVNISGTLIYDKSHVLYGLNRARADIRIQNACVLMEGQMDILMAHQAGFKNTVACSGTSLTEQHLKIIKRYSDNLILAFDTDSAGETATKRGIDLAVQLGFNVEVVSSPVGKDPADCILENKNIWVEAIKNAKKAMDFYFAAALAKNSVETVDGKKKIAAELLPAIKRIPNKIEQTHWLQQISRKIGVQENVLTEEMGKIKNDYHPVVSMAVMSETGRQFNLNREEYVLGLILSDFKIMGKLKDESSEIFANNDLVNIFDKLKTGQYTSLKDLKKKLPGHLAEQVDFLAFKAEAYWDLSGRPELSLENEIEFCLQKMKEPYERKKIIGSI